MQKTIKELKKGDKIKTEYGAFDNYVRVELLDDPKPTNPGSYLLKVRSLYGGGEEFNMYAMNAADKVELLEAQE